MANAVAGVGTVFQRLNPNTAVWDDIAEINSIEGPNEDRDTIDVTSLDTEGGYDEYITGFMEGGTLVLNMNFNRSGYEVMKQDFEIDLVRDYRIVLPDDEDTTLEFEGLVTEIPITMEADNQLTADVTIQVTGEVAIASAGAESSSEVFGLFLDTYIGASAAYSLRKLRTAYEGNCIRVRRTGTSPGEQDIGFVDDFLDTATLLTYVGPHEGYVVKWYDQSGNDRDAYMDNVSYQPLIVASGAVKSFDGTYAVSIEDATADRLAIPKSVYAAADDVSVFIVYGMRTNQTASGIFRSIDSAYANVSAGLQIGHEATTKKPKIYVYRSGANLTAYSNDAITENTRYVLSAVANRTKLYLDVDGVNKVDTADNDSDFTYTHDLSGISTNLYYLQGWVAELIIYPSDKTATRLEMAGEIKTYYDS